MSTHFMIPAARRWPRWWAPALLLTCGVVAAGEWASLATALPAPGPQALPATAPAQSPKGSGDPSVPDAATALLNAPELPGEPAPAF